LHDQRFLLYKVINILQDHISAKTIGTEAQLFRNWLFIKVRKGR